MSDTKRENDENIAWKNIRSCRNRLEILLTTSLAMNHYVQMSTTNDNLNLAGFFFGLEYMCKEMVEKLNATEDIIRYGS